MKKPSRRLVTQLAITALASPLLLVILVILHAWGVLALIASPILEIGRAVSDSMDGFSSPSGGGWLPGLGSAIIADAVLVLIWVWALLMIIVKLFEKFVMRREKA